MIDRAAALTPDPAARAPRLLEAGTFGMMAGRSELARTCLDQASSTALDPMLAAAARGARAYLEMWTGNVRIAREMLVAQVEQIPVEANPAIVVMLLDAALASAMAGDAHGGMALIERAAGQLDGVAPATATLVLVARAAYAGLLGEEDFARRLASHADPLTGLEGGDPLNWARVAIAINPLAWAGNHDEASAVAERLIGIGRGLSAPSMLPYPLAARADLRISTGDWAGAFASANEAVKLADETGQPGVAGYAHCFLARLTAAQGRVEECREHAALVLRSVADHQSESLTVFAHGALGLLELGRGNLDAALGQLERADAFGRSGGLRCHATAPYLPDLVEAAVRADRPDVAARALARLETLDRSRIPRTIGAVERCRDLVTTDPQQAIAHLERAIEIEDAAGVPFEAARSRLLLGERLQRTRQRGDAVPILERALATFEALGATPWATRAGEALGAMGKRPRPQLGSPTRDLTAQELQVADAAARGAHQQGDRGATVSQRQDRRVSPGKYLRQARRPVADRARGALSYSLDLTGRAEPRGFPDVAHIGPS
jgi:tetratricopeptide (TPR) repeat protein